MMKAVRFEYKTGHHSIVDAPKPVPGCDEVLVRIACSALDTAHQAIINKETSGGFIHSRKGRCTWGTTTRAPSSASDPP